MRLKDYFFIRLSYENALSNFHPLHHLSLLDKEPWKKLLLQSIGWKIESHQFQSAGWKTSLMKEDRKKSFKCHGYCREFVPWILINHMKKKHLTDFVMHILMDESLWWMTHRQAANFCEPKSLNSKVKFRRYEDGAMEKVLSKKPEIGLVTFPNSSFQESLAL